MNGGQPIGILSDSLKCWGRITTSPPDILYLSGVGHKAAGTQKRGPCIRDLVPIKVGWVYAGIAEGIAVNSRNRGKARCQAATSHNLDEPRIRVVRPAGVMTGKLSIMTASRSAISRSRTDRFSLENPDAGTRSAFNVSH